MASVTLVFMAAGVGMLPLVLWWMGRLKNRPWDEWQTILDARGHRAYRTLRERMQWDRDTIDETYGKAMAAHYRGASEDAARMLDIGYEFLADVAGERRQLMSQLARYTRMITSILPPPALKPRRFRLAGMTAMAAVALLAHHLLVSGRERFQLRIYVLRLGFGLVLRTLLHNRDVALRPSPELAWARINAGREDFHALSDESLESLRVLLLSLAAHREGVVALQRA